LVVGREAAKLTAALCTQVAICRRAVHRMQVIYMLEPECIPVLGLAGLSASRPFGKRSL
jgi:hypothetical protein